MNKRKPFAHILLTKDGKIINTRQFTEDGQYVYTANDIHDHNITFPDHAPFSAKLVYDRDESSVACVACDGLGYHEEGHCAGFEFGNGQLIVQSGKSTQGDDTGAVLIREALSPVSPNEPIPREAVGKAVLILKFPSFAQASAVATAIAMPNDEEQPPHMNFMGERTKAVLAALNEPYTALVDDEILPERLSYAKRQLASNSSLTTVEREWLQYAIDHMCNYNRPKDATCANVLEALLKRTSE